MKVLHICLSCLYIDRYSYQENLLPKYHKTLGYDVEILASLDIYDETGKKVPCHLGHFFIAIDINAFVDPQKFKKTTGDILRELRGSAKAPGQQRIYTAGEKEYLAWLERKDTGVPLNDNLKKTLQSLNDEYNLDYQFN